MSTFNDVKFLPLKNFEKFENLCLELWRKKIPTVQKNGRNGQKQDGVDIFGFMTKNDDIQWTGIQCKVKSTGSTLNIKEVEEEIKKAKSFSPELTEYIIITTSSRDARLQKYIREKNVKFIKKGLFQIKIIFWDDIELLLGEEINFDIALKFFRDFFIDIQQKGLSISKLFTIEIGVGQSADTHYEIMIGKIPRNKDDSYLGIDYFKGAYYIINLNKGTFSTFPKHCFASDLENVFATRRDEYIIAQWLSSINVDDILYENKMDFDFIITDEEYIKYINSKK